MYKINMIKFKYCLFFINVDDEIVWIPNHWWMMRIQYFGFNFLDLNGKTTEKTYEDLDYFREKIERLSEKKNC